ncbi:Dihydroorotate dehydrogenase B (NAD(+)), catalytic subunit [Anaerohalosphaera lusitana]|uniref:Dihydroorotate dehydrogenase n=1 Tax=Anaerohalosphaera lusitana TaxID=1936003 RepID=A0A1U9NMK1_9BACT|nr:Dihydroorotate dehydrogenase B (NAD(+)), catalytic subunit [Anaerohalosphaera lusitana]
MDISVDFAGINLKNPVFTASGTCGYADELSPFMDVAALGGFITKSISLQPRKGNPTPRIVETDAGMLNAIGLANIGLDRFLDEKIPLIEELDTAVFVNLAGQTIDDYVAVTEKLAKIDAIAGFELNISCPNVKKGGITFGTDPEQIENITKHVKKVAGNKPLMVKLTPTVTDISVTAQAAIDGGADALSLVNTFTAMAIDIETRRPVLANRTGGLSGPAIKPIAVYLVNKVYNEVAKPAGIPLMGLGGITTASDAIEFILAGATTVAVGTASFPNPAASAQIVEGIENYCVEHGISSVKELTGALN